jgi:tRNA 5-methylaminomethyl-2-thiouridine biosynthesis bifunctional protein
LQQAGFSLKKLKGFGKKREMLTGVLTDKPAVTINPPFYFRQPNHSANKQVAIVGGGIASACLCYSLAKRGYDITLLCKDSALSMGASQNRQGALYPLLQADDNALGAFYAHGYQYALRLYHQLLQQGFEFEHQFCGVLLQAFDAKSSRQQQSLLDSGLWSCLYQSVDAQQASTIAGLAVPYGGLFYPQGGWINPSSLVTALITAAKQLTQVKVQLNYSVDQLTQLDNGHWQVNNQDIFPQVAICTGHLNEHLDQTKDLELSPIRGQVSHLTATVESNRLRTVLCNSGYATPAVDGQHSIGASFIKGDTCLELREKEHLKNVERFASGFITETHQPDWLNALVTPTQGRAAIRCASIDHLPLAGAVPDSKAYRQHYHHLWKGLRPHSYPTPPDFTHLYLLSGLGARGLCSAPLASEMVAAQMANEPYPAPTNVLNALNPGRGYIKRLKRKVWI